MTIEPIKITEATDKDAAYILGKLAAADKADEEAKGKTEQARLWRLEAGQRLIEVRGCLPDRAVSGKQGFVAWLDANTIPRRTAYNLMRDAGFTQEERTKHRQKEAKRKREERSSTYRESWTDVLIRHQAIDPVLLRGGSHVGLREKIEKALDQKVPSYFTDSVAADKFLQDYVHAFPTEEPLKHDLSKSDQKKLERAIAIEIKRLQGIFMKELYEEADRRMPEIAAEREKHLNEIQAERERYVIFSTGVKKKITEEEYRFLLQMLHPDRAPKGREEQYAKAFHIIQRLRAYAQA
jgi:hypothetical protein